jgi:hypothetical protein
VIFSFLLPQHIAWKFRKTSSSSSSSSLKELGYKDIFEARHDHPHGQNIPDDFSSVESTDCLSAFAAATTTAAIQHAEANNLKHQKVEKKTNISAIHTQVSTK